MEPPPEPAPEMPRRRRRTLVRVLVAVLAVALVGTVLLGWFLTRPWSIAQVFGPGHYAPGSQVTVAGRITGIFSENTSYGPRVSLQLDGFSHCASGDLFGDPNVTYRLGDTFQTILHFRAYTVNGDPAVSAPELACPFPLGFAAIGRVMDAVSAITGMVLQFNGTAAGDWQEYAFVDENGMAYNPAVLPVTLRKSTPIPAGNPELPAGGPVDSAARWDGLVSLQYVGASGGFQEFPIVDQMTSLAAAASTNGSLRFVDADGNGMVNDGDRLDIHLPPAGSPTAWDTYLVEVGTVLSSSPTYVAGVHYLLNGPQGPLETRPASKGTMLDLRYVGDQIGPPLRSTVGVTGVPFGSPPPLSSIQYLLFVNGSQTLSGDLTTLPTSTLSGTSLTFADANADGQLDVGDRLTVGGIANQTRLGLQLAVAGARVGSIDWIVGYGQPARFIPDVSFTVQGSGPWTVTANVPSWSPELALNRTLRASLLENGLAVITNVSLVTGTIGTFAGGTLSFTDADGDGFLSTGDSFTLQGSPTASYELRVSILFTGQIPPVSV